jgi:hypothetical protein
LNREIWEPGEQGFNREWTRMIETQENAGEKNRKDTNGTNFSGILTTEPMICSKQPKFGLPMDTDLKSEIRPGEIRKINREPRELRERKQKN